MTPMLLLRQLLRKSRRSWSGRRLSWMRLQRGRRQIRDCSLPGLLDQRRNP